MSPLTVYFLLGFGALFGFVFKDILNWINFKAKKDDYTNVILFFPAFLFLLAYWFQGFFAKGQWVLNDPTKISSIHGGLFLWVAVALFVGSGLRLLFDWFYNKF